MAAAASFANASTESNAAKRKVFGIGVMLRLQDGNFFVEKMVQGGPAHMSNQLNIGDCLVHVDGIPTSMKSLSEVLELIRGEAGSTAKLTVYRIPKGGTHPVFETVDIARGDIPRRAQSTAQPPKAAIIQIQPLVHINSPQIMQALKEAQAMGTPRKSMPSSIMATPLSPPIASPSSPWQHSVVGDDMNNSNYNYNNNNSDNSQSYSAYSAPATPRGGGSHLGSYSGFNHELLHSTLASQLAGGATPRMKAPSATAPSKPPTTTTTTTQNVITIEGYILKSKRSGILANMSLRNRYFRLKGSDLCYYIAPADAVPINSLNMTACLAINNSKDKLKGNFCLVMSFPTKNYYLWFPSKDERLKWYTVLSSAKHRM